MLKCAGPEGRPTHQLDLSPHTSAKAVSPLVGPRLNRSPTREREESCGGGDGTGLTGVRATERSRRALARSLPNSSGACREARPLPRPSRRLVLCLVLIMQHRCLVQPRSRPPPRASAAQNLSTRSSQGHSLCVPQQWSVMCWYERPAAHHVPSIPVVPLNRG